MNIFGAKRAGATAGLCSMLIFYMLTDSWVLAACLGLLATALIFSLIHLYANFYGNLYFKSGGKPSKGYSEAQAMAINGQREEACRSLLASFSKDADPEALRVCLKLAVKPPLLSPFAMSACQGLLSHAKVPASEKEEYKRILIEVAPDTTGAKRKS